MKPNQLQLANRQQSQRLKDLGFDIECREMYNPIGMLLPKNLIPKNGLKGSISAPAVALALIWCRNNHNLHGFVHPVSNTYTYEIKTNRGEYVNSTNRTYNKCYDKTEIALLDEILTILEQKL